MTVTGLMPGRLLRLMMVLAIVLAAVLPGRAVAGSVATLGSPARMSVAIPPAARDSGVVLLELGVRASRQPTSGHLGAAVRLRRPGGPSVEVGRMTVTPGAQRYQFNIGRALRREGAGAAEVEIELIDRGDGPVASGAELAIGRARIVTR